ncbi:MAG: response regulator [Burkholderiales bacterium]|nr:MAG: response regulator [Burkholderiales bacterium]
MSENRLLIVDDDPVVRRMLVEYLSGHGFEVAEADSGAAMRERLQAAPPDLVLLDLGLPGEDGLTLARYLREHHDCGIVMVTGTAGTVDRIVGLEVGADDYIAKPFEPRELLARIKSVLRRLQPAAKPRSQENRRLRVGRCEIDLAARRLTDGDGRDVALTAMEFDLLKAFLDHPNQVLSRDRLLNLTRDRDWEPFDRSIDIRITRLRRKIEPDPENPRVIQTVRGAGYMYVPAASD